eukprot:12920805-Prorocentrum_lima.AAC.1
MRIAPACCFFKPAEANSRNHQPHAWEVARRKAKRQGAAPVPPRWGRLPGTTCQSLSAACRTV